MSPLGIRANPLLTNDTTNGINSAILRYDGAPVSEPPDRYVNASLGVVMEENKVQVCLPLPPPGYRQKIHDYCFAPVVDQPFCGTFG